MTLSGLAVPERILGVRRRGLLRADAYIQWSSWFVESLADPRRYIDSSRTYAHVFKDALDAVRTYFHQFTAPEISALAKEVAEQVWQRVRLLRELRSRRSFGREERLNLLDTAGDPARCWICGFAFSGEAVDAFVSGPTRPADLPLFVDVFKPRGLVRRDSEIEIDHVEAWSAGGGEGGNLKLACGWCNRHKSAHCSIYDVSGAVVEAGANPLGIHTLPQKFWAIRLLATVGKCEWSNGCTSTTQTAELTVEPILRSGAMAPSNIRVVCAEHHWLGPRRLLPPQVVRTAWAGPQR
jgi:hypothetical protein